MQQWLQKFSVSKKMNAITVMFAVIIGLSTLAFVLAAQSFKKDFSAFERKSLVGVKTVLETEKDLNYFSRLSREIMLGGDFRQNYDKAKHTRDKVVEHFEVMETLISTDKERQLYEDAQKSTMDFLNASIKLLGTVEGGKVTLGSVYKTYKKKYSPLAKASRKHMDNLVASKMEQADHQQNAFKDSIYTWEIAVGLGSVVAIVLVLLILMAIASQIKHSLSTTQNGLISFFSFLNGKSQSADLIGELGKDEFGQMAVVIDTNINELQAKVQEQRQALDDFKVICNRAGNGFLYDRIEANYSDESLRELSVTINTLLDRMEGTFGVLLNILSSYAKGDYSASVEHIERYNGSFASVVNALGSLSVSSSEIFAIIDRFSKEFKTDATSLAKLGEEISTSANEQASSLEETAAALEELTSNVSANAAKADEMANVAKESLTAAHNGNDAANASFKAMNEIFEATEAINEAVSIIDNIAFQTNILSLNAAVEAARAGDAGKGFAVVAQEVRNLANRSADAAKQIQGLAKDAQEKSQGGLRTSKGMMESFTLISDTIDKTEVMVRDVANASREQLAGISQINDAVAQLDQMTQQNAKGANNIASIGGEILSKSEQFGSILTEVKYDTSYEGGSCDASLLFEMAKLKLDHVAFKENNYAKFKDNKQAWKVVSHHDCALGKWIDSHSDMPYAKTAAWKSLLEEHAKVHECTQEFIDAGIAAVSTDEMMRLGRKLEEATQGVFEGLDMIKVSKCQSQQKEQQSYDYQIPKVSSEIAEPVKTMPEKPVSKEVDSGHDEHTWETF